MSEGRAALLDTRWSGRFWKVLGLVARSTLRRLRCVRKHVCRVLLFVGIRYALGYFADGLRSMRPICSLRLHALCDDSGGA